MARTALIGAAATLWSILVAPSARCADAVAVNRVVVPTVTIYPREIIQDITLAFRDDLGFRGSVPLWISDKSLVTGKTTRRTLLANQPINPADIEDSIIVANGAKVTLTFSENGITITGAGIALGAGGLGSTIRFRNNDTSVVGFGEVIGGSTIRVGNR